MSLSGFISRCLRIERRYHVSVSSTITPQQIAVPPAKLDRQRLEIRLCCVSRRTRRGRMELRLSSRPCSASSSSSAYMFDCRKAEAELIRMPQFTTDIAPERFETLKIHSVHKCCESRARFHYYLHMAGPGHLTRSERYYQS